MDVHRKLKTAGLAALLVFGIGCSAGLASLDPGAPTPTPAPTPGLTAVDLLFTPDGASGYPPQILNIEAADTIGSLNIVLGQGFTVSGVVGSPGMPPVPLPEGAQVRAIGTGTTSSRLEATDSVDLVTGAFSLQLSAGTYDLIVTPRTNAPQPTKPTVVFQSIDIDADFAGLELVVPPGPIVSGQVQHSNGTPVGGGWEVNAVDGPGVGTAQRAVTDVNGNYELEVPRLGLYTIRITPPAGELSPIVYAQGIDIDTMLFSFPYRYPDPNPWNPVLITGQAEHDLAPPIPNYAGMNVRVVGQLTGAAPNEAYTFTATGSIDGLGNFSAPALGPGIYTLFILPEAFDPYAHRIIAAVNVDGTGDVDLDNALTGLVRKNQLFGSIQGPDGRTANGVVLRWSTTDLSGFVFAGVTDSTGAFNLGVNQGPYEVELLPPPGNELIRHRATAEVAASFDGPYNYALPEGQDITGVITGSFNNQPVPNVLISVLDPNTDEPVGADDALGGLDGAFTTTIPRLLQ